MQLKLTLFMKKIFACILFLLVSNIYAQQFKLVHDHLPAYYSFWGDHYTFSIDSSFTFSDHIIHYASTTIKDTSIWRDYHCLDAHAGDILGKVLIQTDIKTSILNFRGDSIHYHHKTAPQDNYVFYSYLNGNYLLATHMSTTFDEVLGMPDSVKHFTLQAFSQSGDSVENNYNGQTFDLTRNYGLVSTFNNYMFPFDQNKFEISGFTNPVTGIYSIDWKDAFYLETGDEFHIRETRTYWDYDIKVNETKDLIRIVLHRKDFADSIQFTYIECQRIITYAPSGFDTLYIADTVVEETIKEYPTLQWMNVNPGQYYTGSGEYYSAISQTQNDTYNSRIQKSIVYDFIAGDSCLDYTIVCPQHIKHSFIEGCGGPYYIYYFGFDYPSRELIYINKGGEEWGMPLAEDCEDLLTATEEVYQLTNSLSVYPNPLNNHLTLSIAGNTAIRQIRIFNTNGKLLWDDVIPEKTTQIINTSYFSPGLYIYEISMVDGSIYRGKIIKK